jgi:hypothetical protein
MVKHGAVGEHLFDFKKVQKDDHQPDQEKKKIHQ